MNMPQIGIPLFRFRHMILNVNIWW